MTKAIRCIRNLALGTAVSLLGVSTVMSDDIDVYVAPPATADPGDTLVVFTLDLRPNVLASQVCTGGECDELFTDPDVDMGDQLDGDVTFFELLVAALKKVLYDIDNHTVKIALMIPHANSPGNLAACTGFQRSAGGEPVTPGCSNGAYVLSAFKRAGDDPATPGDDEELDEFFEKLESIPLKAADGSDNDPHAYQIKELFFEMFRYLTAGEVYNGRNGLNDFGTDDEYNIDDDEDTISVNPIHNEVEGDPSIAELMWDTDAETNGVYMNTLDAASQCSSIVSVNMTFGVAAGSADRDADEAIALEPPAGFGFSPSSNRGEEEVLEYLAGTDLDDGLRGTQNITSYFVTVTSGASGGGGAVNRANAWARAGGSGSALVVNESPEDLVDQLGQTIDEILSVSTTFVSAATPANVFNQAEVLNEVLVALFEANDSKKPFWIGNVKKLTTTTIEEAVFKDIDGDGNPETTTEERRILVDVLEADKADPASAISPDGRIRAGALTYWTRPGDGNEHLPAPTTQEEAFEFQEGTDGRKVDRGGAGQVKPGYLDPGSPGEANTTSPTTITGPRKLFTEPDDGTNGAADDMVDFDAGSSAGTAVELLQDPRNYPGSGLTYGEHLFLTVMDDCPGCPPAYGDATSTEQATARLRVNNLIRFARGLDVDLDTALSTTAPKRSWWQADPLHGRPLALNYGARPDFTEERPDVRVVVTGNDGLVQMIRDGRQDDGSEDGVEDGVEAWAFLPREFVPLQKRLLQGEVGEYKPGVPVSPGDPPRTPLHPYAMDGAPTALVIDNNLDGTINAADPPSTDDPDTAEDETLDGGDRVYLFIGQRRGGKRYYALDVSDPDAPKFLWSIGKDDADGEFAQMAQSWSLLRAGVMAIDEGDAVRNRPVLVFTAGYNGDDGGDGAGDLGKDSRVRNHDAGTEILGTNDEEGNALFIVNALSGELIWKAAGPPTADSLAAYDPTTLTFEHPGLVDSVAASPTILDSDGNGLIDRVYFPDTGGNVWRMDAGVPDRSQWTVTKLFSGGRHFQADNDDDRRFFHPVDVVLARDESGDFDAVIAASGDRAHPLGDVVENWIYMVKDRATTSGIPGPTLTHNDLADLTDNCLQGDPDDFSGCTDGVAADNIVNGWKVQLRQCEAGGTDPKCGEKSLAQPLTIEGIVFLTSYLPVLDTGDEPTTCGPKEGGGLFYALDLQTASGVIDLDPSNDAGGVDTPDRFRRLKTRGIPSDVVVLSPDEVMPPDMVIEGIPGRKSGKTFWYERRFR